MCAAHHFVRVVIAYHGGRGHTAAPARAVPAGAAQVPRTVAASAEADRTTADRWHRVDDADAIVFGAPACMGTASAAFHAVP